MNQLSSHAIILLSGGLGVLTALYLMKTRRRMSAHRLISHQSSKVEDKPRTLEKTLSGDCDNDPDPDSEKNHDKDVGFGTDPTWTSKNRPDKKDLLHTGSSKGGKLLIVFVGLPGSGKTFIARKVSRFLRWISYRTRVFSVATYRLEKLGAHNADFFDPENQNNVQQRNEVFLLALEDAMRYLKKDGEIAVLDGSNSTSFRRELIRNRVSKEDGFGILWIEKILSADEIVSNHLATVRSSPDFSSEADFRQRILHYQNNYDTVRDEEGSYIKIIGTKADNIQLRGITGFLRTKISSFVMNIHTSPRTIYLVRAGESEYIARGLIGGDSALTAEGVEFAKSLGDFFENDDSGFTVSSPEGLVVWSSTMKSAIQTAEHIKTKLRVVEWRALREIESGVCDGLTYDQIRVRYPKEYDSRQQDKLTYRYPRGESYFDVITRLEPLIFEMERVTHPLLIIGHLAVLRCVLAYLLDIPVHEVPFRKIDMKTVIRLDPQVFGCKSKQTVIPDRTSTEE